MLMLDNFALRVPMVTVEARVMLSTLDVPLIRATLLVTVVRIACAIEFRSVTSPVCSRPTILPTDRNSLVLEDCVTVMVLGLVVPPPPDWNVATIVVSVALTILTTLPTDRRKVTVDDWVKLIVKLATRFTSAA